jgi:hypothetical protein
MAHGVASATCTARHREPNPSSLTESVRSGQWGECMEAHRTFFRLEQGCRGVEVEGGKVKSSRSGIRVSLARPGLSGRLSVVP